MKLSVIFILLFSLGDPLLATALNQPTISEAEEAIRALQKKLGIQKPVTINSIPACFPALKHDSNFTVCMINGKSGNDSSSEPIAFQRVGKVWQVAGNGERTVEPACPPISEAQIELRKISGLADLVVLREIDEGAGSFTTDRGMTRDNVGPLRLMCRYDTKSSLNPDRLYITYCWRDGDKYLIDKDVEIWD